LSRTRTQLKSRDSSAAANPAWMSCGLPAIGLWSSFSIDD